MKHQFTSTKLPSAPFAGVSRPPLRQRSVIKIEWMVVRGIAAVLAAMANNGTATAITFALGGNGSSVVLRPVTVANTGNISRS